MHRISQGANCRKCPQRWWVAVALYLVAAPANHPPLAAGEPSCFLVRTAAPPTGVERTTEHSSDDLATAELLYRTGEYDACLEATRAALAAQGANRRWHELHLRVLLTTGQYAAAVAAQREALQLFRDSLTLRRLGAEALRFQNATAAARALEQEILDLARRYSWSYDSAADQVLLARMLLERGGDPKTILKELLQPHAGSDFAANLAIGQLGLDKGDYALAAEHFLAATALRPDDPDGHFGLAAAYQQSDPDKAQAALQTALRCNPRHIPSLLQIAENQIDAEQYSAASATLAQILEVHPTQPRALAFQAVLAHLANQPQAEGEYRKLALSTWEGNPEVDHWIGKKLSQKYRFREGAEYQRRALVYDAQYLPAKIQLTQDLLRLGAELEGWKLADEVNAADGYNILAHNLVTLRDHMAGYTTLRNDDFIVRMEPREARIYGDRVLDLLQSAKTTLEAKYDIAVSRPVTIEIFARQPDFAIRTFGLPGGAGFLGVSFGQVVTMNSPASQGATPSNWQAVLWHEFCHVVTLQKSQNKMPRWLSEGISVYEERQANPAWGQAMSPRFQQMILGDDLTPVSGLSAAFLDPPSPAHLQLAYFESSLVVEYLIEKFGPELLNRILLELSLGTPISEALARYTGSSELLDREFAAYIREKATAFAPGVEFADPADPTLPAVDATADRVAAEPLNFSLQWAWANRLCEQQAYAEAEAVLQRLIAVAPELRGTESPYRLLAELYRHTGQAEQERAALRQLVQREADDAAGRLRLAELALAQQDWDEVQRMANEAIGIQPLAVLPYRYAQQAAVARADHRSEIAALQALLELAPTDPAQLHYELAQAYWHEQRPAEAKRQVLMALENAPRFRAAQQLLLRIVTPPSSAEAPADTPSGNSDSGSTDTAKDSNE